MIWIGNIFVLFGVLTASLCLGYALLGDCLSRKLGRPDRASYLALPLIQMVAYVTIWVFVVRSPYRATPVSFFTLWCLILVGVNLAFLIGIVHQGAAENIRKVLYNFVKIGGFWGNHGVQPNNPHRPTTRHNAWGMFALAFCVFAFFCLILHRSSWYWDLDGLLKTPESIERLAKERPERFTGTPLGSFLDWLKATPQDSPSTVLQLYPRSDSWFWLTLTALGWAIFANLWCRRESIPETAHWLADKLSWWSDESVATGSSGPEPLSRAAARAVTEVVKSHAASTRPAEAKAAAAGASHESMTTVLGRQIVAEGTVDLMKQAPALVQRLIRWLRKFGHKAK